MVLKFGSIELSIELADQPDRDLLDVTLRELLSSRIAIHTEDAEKPTRQRSAQPVPHANKSDTETGLIFLKSTIGLTNHTIIMVSSKVLGIRTTTPALPSKWEEISRAARAWRERKLNTEDIWAITVSPVSTSRMGSRTVAIGINKSNQLVFLGLTAGNVNSLYKDLVARGLKTKGVQFGMISIHSGDPDDFTEVFPKAIIGRDWEEYIELADDPDSKADIKEAMLSPDIQFAKMQCKLHQLPKELVNYYSFDKKLWRALRTASTHTRLEKDLRSKTKRVDSPEMMEFAITWTLLRLQYQWYKTPVDSEVLSNLKYISIQMDAIKD